MERAERVWWRPKTQGDNFFYYLELASFVYNKNSSDVEEVGSKFRPQDPQSGWDRDAEVTCSPAGPPAELSVPSVRSDKDPRGHCTWQVWGPGQEVGVIYSMRRKGSMGSLPGFG